MPAVSTAPRMGAAHSGPVVLDVYQPTIPALTAADLTTRDPIPHLTERIDLRRLYPGQHGNPVKTFCPWHRDVGNPSLGVFKHNAFCFTCRHSAGAIEAIRVLCRTHSPAETFAIARHLLGAAEKQVDAPLLPLDQALLRQYRYGIVKEMGLREWLTKKYGLSEAAQVALDIGHSGPAYTLPVFDLAGQLMNIRFRRDPNKWVQPPPPAPPLPRYWGMDKRNQPMWYFPQRLQGSSIAAALTARYGKAVVILTEGELDAAVLEAQLGLPAISITNGCGAWKHEAISLTALAGCTVWVMYDADEAGDAAGQELTATLHTLGITAHQVRLPHEQGKDPSELVVAGWTRDDFRRLLITRH